MEGDGLSGGGLAKVKTSPEGALVDLGKRPPLT